MFALTIYYLVFVFSILISRYQFSFNSMFSRQLFHFLIHSVILIKFINWKYVTDIFTFYVFLFVQFKWMDVLDNEYFEHILTYQFELYVLYLLLDIFNIFSVLFLFYLNLCIFSSLAPSISPQKHHIHTK